METVINTLANLRMELSRALVFTFSVMEVNIVQSIKMTNLLRNTNENQNSRSHL